MRFVVVAIVALALVTGLTGFAGAAGYQVVGKEDAIALLWWRVECIRTR